MGHKRLELCEKLSLESCFYSCVMLLCTRGERCRRRTHHWKASWFVFLVKNLSWGRKHEVFRRKETADALVVCEDNALSSNDRASVC